MYCIFMTMPNADKEKIWNYFDMERKKSNALFQFIDLSVFN